MTEVWHTAHVTEITKQLLTAGSGSWNGDEHRPYMYSHRAIDKALVNISNFTFISKQNIDFLKRQKVIGVW